MTVDQPGTFDLQLKAVSDVDVDHVLWGPYASRGDAMATCDRFLCSGPSGLLDSDYSSGSDANIVFEGDAAGQVFVLLITNYDEESTEVTLTMNNPGTTGTLSCAGVACSDVVVEHCEGS